MKKDELVNVISRKIFTPRSISFLKIDELVNIISRHNIYTRFDVRHEERIISEHIMEHVYTRFDMKGEERRIPGHILGKENSWT